MMKQIAAGILLLVVSTSAFAWNNAGHKVIALIAYQRLTPAAQRQVDALLAKHPGYAKWTEVAAKDNRGRTAFLAASVWPDEIRSDPRFYDDNGRATPPIPGLPAGAQARHAGWHFINMPFSTDGTRFMAAATPNILTQLQLLGTIATMPDQMKTYLLPWLLHLVADVHLPVHTTVLFSRQFPQGDRGGNSIQLTNGLNLHRYWDSRLGSREDERFLNELATTIQRRYPKPLQLKLQPEQWVSETFALHDKVYAFTGTGTDARPAEVSDQYSVMAREMALQRAALAGYRLADFLNARFK
jgi:hypothetical protein